MEEKKSDNFHMHPVILKLMGEYFEYLEGGTDITIEVKDGIFSIKEISGVFNDNVSKQAICLKLIHNLIMTCLFVYNFPYNYNLNTSSMEGIWDFEKKDNYKLKIHVDTMSARLLEREGFGKFFVNSGKLLLAIGRVPEELNKYIEELSRKNDKEFLERINTFYDSNEPFLFKHSFDEYLDYFINENSDFFKDM